MDAPSLHRGASHVHGDLRPEMRIAAINHQPVVILHGVLNIQGQMQRVDAAAEFGCRRFGIDIGMHLRDPFDTAPTVEIEPVAVASRTRRVAKRDQRVEKGAGSQAAPSAARLESISSCEPLTQTSSALRGPAADCRNSSGCPASPRPSAQGRPRRRHPSTDDIGGCRQGPYIHSSARPAASGGRAHYRPGFPACARPPPAPSRRRTTRHHGRRSGSGASRPRPSPEPAAGAAVRARHAPVPWPTARTGARSGRHPR